MLDKKRCHGYCDGFIEASRAKYNQTRYCENCARTKKRENSEDARKYQDRKEYLSAYMHDYRKKKKKSQILSDLEKIELLAIRITGLVGVLLICVYIVWRHIVQFLK